MSSGERRRYRNANLREQSADNYDLGVIHTSRGADTTDLSMFRSGIQDLIERLDRGSRYQNLAPVRITGVGLSTASTRACRTPTSTPRRRSLRATAASLAAVRSTPRS